MKETPEESATERLKKWEKQEGEKREGGRIKIKERKKDRELSKRKVGEKKECER